LWIYFTPLPRAGFSFRGFCLSHDCDSSSLPTCPLVVSSMSPNSSCPLSPAPSTPPSGLCPVRESVPPHTGYSPVRGADPLLVFPPPGFHPKQRSRAFTRFATLAPCRPHLTVMRTIDLWGPLPRLACFSRNCRPARGSWPTLPTLLRTSST